MTKEALDRIKEAYYSGLKVQIWFDGHWENFDVRDYPINTDPFSEHRMYRIVGSAYVDIAEKQIADLKKENAELEAQIDKMKCCGNCKKLKGRFDSKTNINILYCSDSDMKQIEVGFQMCCCKWEIKEND